jgi:hypothetical protein
MATYNSRVHDLKEALNIGRSPRASDVFRERELVPSITTSDETEEVLKRFNGMNGYHSVSASRVDEISLFPVSNSQLGRISNHSRDVGRWLKKHPVVTLHMYGKTGKKFWILDVTEGVDIQGVRSGFNGNILKLKRIE